MAQVELVELDDELVDELELELDGEVVMVLNEAELLGASDAVVCTLGEEADDAELLEESEDDNAALDVDAELEETDDEDAVLNDEGL